MVKMTLRELKSTNTVAAIRYGYKDALKEIVKRLEKETFDYAPQDTGALKGSISSSVKGNQGIVKADMDYAAYQEFGTMYMDAANNGVGFMRPAVNKIKTQISQIVSVAIRKAFRRF